MLKEAHEIKSPQSPQLLVISNPKDFESSQVKNSVPSKVNFPPYSTKTAYEPLIMHKTARSP